MFKKGFTLQELLITIAIIGVVVAISAPAIKGMFPDKTKVKYMKTYTTLTSLTNEILEDNTLYYTTYGNTGEPNCSGLRCWAAPINYSSCDDSWTCTGVTKFPAILATKLNTIERNNEDSVVTFTTTDGTDWSFSYDNTRVITSITINIDPADGDNNCLYANTCTNPKQFTFELDNFGGIKATDALGQAYLQNPTELNNTSKDKEAATKILNTQTKEETPEEDTNENQSEEN